MIQFKRHFRNAIWFSVGNTLGGLILPQVVFSGPSTSDQPFHIQAAIYLGVSFVFAFLFFCGMDWFRSRGKK